MKTLGTVVTVLVLLWIIGSSPTQASNMPKLVVSEDIVILEDEVSANIPLLLDPRPEGEPRITAVSAFEDLLPSDQIRIRGNSPAWMLQLVPAAGMKGDSSVTLEVLLSNGSIIRKTLTVSVVMRPPTLLQNPEPSTIVSGGALRLQSRAKGSAPLSYLWKKDGKPLTNQTNAFLEIPIAKGPDSGSYSVEVKNPVGLTQSSGVFVQVVEPPILTNQPSDQTVIEGASVKFEVEATGLGPFRYQWRRNGLNLNGATNRVLELHDVIPHVAGVYTAMVEGASGATTSRPATLLVQALTLLLSDRFESATSLVGAGGTLNFSTTTASSEVNEPAHAGRNASRSYWAKWVAPADGVFRLDTKGSTFDTVLAVYTGPALGSLVEQASDDDFGGHLTSALSLTASKGMEYFVALDGSSKSSSHATLTWRFDEGAAPVPRILKDPVSRVVQPGGFTLVEVEAEGVQAYQWELNASDVPGGITPRWRVRAATPSDTGNYQVKLSNGRETIFSERASIQLGPDPKSASKDKFFEPLILGEPVAPVSRASLQNIRWRHSLWRQN